MTIPNEWQVGLCDCCAGGCCRCCYAISCTACLAGDIAARTGGSYCLDCYFAGYCCPFCAPCIWGNTRSTIRLQEGIDGNCCHDFCTMLFCTCCALLQEINHLDKSRGTGGRITQNVVIQLKDGNGDGGRNGYSKGDRYNNNYGDDYRSFREDTNANYYNNRNGGGYRDGNNNNSRNYHSNTYDDNNNYYHHNNEPNSYHNNNNNYPGGSNSYSNRDEDYNYNSNRSSNNGSGGYSNSSSFSPKNNFISRNYPSAPEKETLLNDEGNYGSYNNRRTNNSTSTISTTTAAASSISQSKDVVKASVPSFVNRSGRGGKGMGNSYTLSDINDPS